MAQPEATCGRLGGADAPAASLHRFVLGEDEAPRQFGEGEAEVSLRDPFAAHVLLRGTFPAQAEGVLADLDVAIGPDHPLAASTERTFVVSETSQVLRGKDGVSRGLRFVVTRGEQTQDGPDLILSVGGPDSTSVEVMAWDPENRGFNYYRTAKAAGAWVWAGNSQHALVEPTRGLGPFEAHPSGNFLMKELKRPWVHWHSPDAPMDQRDLEPGDPLAQHRWFRLKKGAYELEESVAKPAVIRWNRERVERIANAGRLDNPAPIFEQIVGAPADRLPRPTVNLTSSMTRWSQAQAGEAVALPPTFFVDVDCLTDLLRMPRPEQLSVAGDRYVRTVLSEGVSLQNGSFNEDRDAHFASVVPERAFEDVNLLDQLLARKLLINPRLALCLLLVDFPNPVFSESRASLLPVIEGFSHDTVEAESYATALGDHIAASAQAGSPGSASFAELWTLAPDQLSGNGAEQLEAYYKAVADRIDTDEGIAEYLRLAGARRVAHEDLLIHETNLLLPRMDADARIRMHPDGGVR